MARFHLDLDIVAEIEDTGVRVDMYKNDDFQPSDSFRVYWDDIYELATDRSLTLEVRTKISQALSTLAGDIAADLTAD